MGDVICYDIVKLWEGRILYRSDGTSHDKTGDGTRI